MRLSHKIFNLQKFSSTHNSSSQPMVNFNSGKLCLLLPIWCLSFICVAQQQHNNYAIYAYNTLSRTHHHRDRRVDEKYIGKFVSFLYYIFPSLVGCETTFYGKNSECVTEQPVRKTWANSSHSQEWSEEKATRRRWWGCYEDDDDGDFCQWRIA